eukprot:1161297-Pelagomonas_calceolata.AAC.11
MPETCTEVGNPPIDASGGSKVPKEDEHTSCIDARGLDCFAKPDSCLLSRLASPTSKSLR